MSTTDTHSHALTVRTFRVATTVGTRLRGAVIPDGIADLAATLATLPILGTGRQATPPMRIEDYIDALGHVLEHATAPLATYNLRTPTTTTVNRLRTSAATSWAASRRRGHGRRPRLDGTGDGPKTGCSIANRRTRLGAPG